MSRQITKSEFSANIVEQEFTNDFRELVAPYSGVTEGITAFLQMNYPEELVALSNAPDAGLYRRLLAQALITLIDRGALMQLAPLNDLAIAELETLRNETGIYPEGYVAPAPAPKPPTAAELLEAEIRQDFATLRSDEMRKKRQGNRQYEETYQRIASTLGSSTTGLFDATAGRYVGR